jgi:hypothetical protein
MRVQVISSAQSAVASITAQITAEVASVGNATVGTIDSMEAKYLPAVRRYDR